jgi:hypothetical protein
MEVEIGTLECGVCYEKSEASLFVEKGKLVARCENQHEWQIDIYSPLALAVKNSKEWEALPDKTLKATLEEARVPYCFGTMERRGCFVPNYYAPIPEDVASPEEAFLAVINTEIDKARENGRKLAACAKCSVFERCCSISMPL